MARPTGRRARRRSVAAPLPVVLATLLLLAPTATVMAAVKTWSAVADPGIVHQPATAVLVTATNLGIDSPSAAIGCVKISIPADVDVLGSTIVSEPAGKSWVVAASGGSPTVVTAHAVTNADWLVGGSAQESVGIVIAAAPSSNGATTWTATAYRTKNCTLASAEVVNLVLDVIGPSATPKPTPAPTPQPTPTPTPQPNPTPTPQPNPTPTPTTRPGATPAPTSAGVSPGSSTLPSSSPGASTNPVPSADSTPGTSTDPSSGPTAGLDASGIPVAPGGFDGGGGTPGSPDEFTMGGTAAGEIRDLTGELSLSGLGVEWAVPAIVMTVPGLLLIIVILIQAMGASAWLPIARRNLGTFGIGARHRRT